RRTTTVSRRSEGGILIAPSPRGRAGLRVAGTAAPSVRDRACRRHWLRRRMSWTTCRVRQTGGCPAQPVRCPAYPAVGATTRLGRTSPASSPHLPRHAPASSNRSLRWLSVAGAQRRRGGLPLIHRGSQRDPAPSHTPWPTPPVTESATECGSPCCRSFQTRAHSYRRHRRCQRCLAHQLRADLVRLAAPAVPPGLQGLAAPLGLQDRRGS